MNSISSSLPYYLIFKIPDGSNRWLRLAPVLSSGCEEGGERGSEHLGRWGTTSAKIRYNAKFSEPCTGVGVWWAKKGKHSPLFLLVCFPPMYSPSFNYFHYIWGSPRPPKMLSSCLGPLQFLTLRTTIWIHKVIQSFLEKKKNNLCMSIYWVVGTTLGAQWVHNEHSVSTWEMMSVLRTSA